MKGKKFTYVLGLLALVVWGLILYRIFDTIGEGDEDVFIPVKHDRDQEPINDYSTQADTAHLLLNYNDPFRQIKQVDTPLKVVQNARVVKTSLLPAPKPVFSWGFVKYSGYTRSAGSSKLLAVMIINGQTAILQEGETASDLKLIKNYQDSVKVTFKGRMGYIRMQ